MTPQKMPETFAQWMRPLEMSPDPAWLQRRWTGVAKHIDTVTYSGVEAMLRISFRSKHAPAPDELAKLRDAMKSADPSFETTGNGRELELLSGATLDALMTGVSPMAAAAALAVCTASLDGARKVDSEVDLAARAADAVELLSENARAVKDATLAVGKRMTLDLASATAALSTAPDASGFANAITIVQDQVNNLLDELQRRQASMVGALQHSIEVYEEELDVLWWAQGERSVSLRMPFASVPKPALPLVAAGELSALTKRAPGPVSARALLSRIGLRTKPKVSIAEAVNACPTDWIASRAYDSVSPLAHPIHLAILRRHETGSESAWIEAWSATAGVKAAQSLGPLELAEQFFRESLLLEFFT